MRRLLRFRPSPAMVVALIALFVTLSGSASAVLLITSRNIKNGTIRGRDIHNNTILGKKLKGRVPLAANANGLDGPLAPGETLTGVWATGSGGPEGYAATHFEFRPPLPARLDANHVVFVVGDKGPHCPGIGRAARGYLCVYRQQGVQTLQSIGDGKVAGAAPDGAEMFLNTSEQSNFAAGHWAVTAPRPPATTTRAPGRHRADTPNGE